MGGGWGGGGGGTYISDLRVLFTTYKSADLHIKGHYLTTGEWYYHLQKCLWTVSDIYNKYLTQINMAVQGKTI